MDEDEKELMLPNYVSPYNKRFSIQIFTRFIFYTEGQLAANKQVPIYASKLLDIAQCNEIFLMQIFVSPISHLILGNTRLAKNLNFVRVNTTWIEPYNIHAKNLSRVSANKGTYLWRNNKYVFMYKTRNLLLTLIISLHRLPLEFDFTRIRFAKGKKEYVC